MLPRKLRFPIRKEGNLLKKDGHRFYTSFLSIVHRRNSLPHSRAAFIISKKISLKAVVRNKLKRQLSVIVQEKMTTLKTPADLLFIPKPGIIKLDQEKLVQEISDALLKIGRQQT